MLSFKKALFITKRVKLNCRRFSYSRPFAHDIITHNTTHSNMCIFIGAISQSTSLGKWEEVDKESTKKTYKGELAVKKVMSLTQIFLLFSVTQSFLFGFSRSSYSITESSKKSTSKKKYTSVSEITI